MLNLKNVKYIEFSNHALERSKQRLKINGLDPNSIEYKYGLIEIIRNKSSLIQETNSDYEYVFIYNESSYKLIVKIINNEKVLVKTLIKKD